MAKVDATANDLPKVIDVKVRLGVECVLRVLHAVAAHRHVRRRREELSCMQLGSLLCSKQHGRADAISPEFLPQLRSLGINTYLIPEPMGTCVEMLWFWSQNPWEINSFLAFALSRVVGKG